MEAIVGILMFLFVATALLAVVFLTVFQPLWSIVDVATSEEHSSGTKAAVILLTLLLLGPIMTFFYACFGTRSRALRRGSIFAAIALLVGCVGAIGLAAVQPAAKGKLTEIFGNNVVERGDSDSSAGEPAATMIGKVEADSINVAPFTAVYYLPVDERKWSVSLADFTLRGPREDSALPIKVPSIYPLTQIAIDASGPVTYGITTHKVGKIIPTTGHFVELEVDPALPRMSWPSAVAFDARNRKLVVSSRSGVYTYDSATGEWLQPAGFDELNFHSLTYNEKDSAFYGIVSRPVQKEIDRIVRLNETGAVVATIPLSHPLPIDGMPTGLLQLRKIEDIFVVLVAAHYSRTDSGANELVDSVTYVVDSGTGQVNQIIDGE